MRDMPTGRRRIHAMKYTIYEDPITHKYALLRLPDKFEDGDRLRILPTDRLFDSREAAVAGLSELLNQEE
jgi:hypothetical protein